MNHLNARRAVSSVARRIPRGYSGQRTNKPGLTDQAAVGALIYAEADEAAQFDCSACDRLMGHQQWDGGVTEEMPRHSAQKALS
jgi:hypothetical protein